MAWLRATRASFGEAEVVVTKKITVTFATRLRTLHISHPKHGSKRVTSKNSTTILCMYRVTDKDIDTAPHEQFDELPDRKRPWRVGLSGSPVPLVTSALKHCQLAWVGRMVK